MKYFSLLGYLVVCVTKCSTLPRDKRNACPPYNPCDLQSPCENGGTCRMNDTGTACNLVCDCGPHFTGQKCEERLNTSENVSQSNITCETDECVISNPCYNGGTCVMDNTTCTATCLCANNFMGHNCTQSLPDQIPPICFDYCAGRPCMNGGTCRQNASCYMYCDCTEQFTGNQCQYPMTSLATDSTPSPPTTSLRPPEERDCGGGFVCLHGRCTDLEDGSTFCYCDPGFIGTFCQTSCDLDCGEHGICDRLNLTSTSPVCSCQHPYTGPTCLDVIVESPSISDEWKFWILGCSLVLLLVLGGFCVLIYTLLKKRNIFIMKLKYYFQPFEDDDGKEFDAFISYKSAPEDEAFVYRTLYTELEVKRGYKLCLHQRDFTVGDTIANNILKAIANSRRTILVLSPRYMESDFTRFEYQEAHAEMLKMQHKVIPLLLEDVAQQKHLMDRTLASILKSITYIEWPGDGSEGDLEKFWTRLELSLPKKRSASSTSTSSYPVLSFSDSSFDSQMTDIDMVSMENGDTADIQNTTAGANCNRNMNSKIRNDNEKNVFEIDKIYHIEQSLKEKNLTNRESKDFFIEPVDEERFKQMKEKAMGYENCLSTYL